MRSLGPRGPGFDLNKDQHVLVPGDQINLAVGRSVTTGENLKPPRLQKPRRALFSENARPVSFRTAFSARFVGHFKARARS